MKGKSRFIVILLSMGLLLAQTACDQQTGTNSQSADKQRDLQEVYKRSCGVCHDTGMANAPKRGDVAEWDKRIKEKGMDTLIENVTKGFNAMPARGMCFDCTAEEYRALIEYLRK